MTGKHWLALAVIGSGLSSLAAMALYAKGKREEAFALAFTAGLLSTTYAAARVLSASDVPHFARSDSPVTGPTIPGLAPT